MSGNNFDACAVSVMVGPVMVDRSQKLIEQKRKNEEVTAMRYALLWLLGVPLPVLIIIYLIFH